MKRRPLGIGGRKGEDRKSDEISSSEKKAKGSSKDQEPSIDDGNDETVTVTLPDTLDEVSELKALFDSALSKIGEGEADDGLMLLRGVIHESDRILRSRDSANDSSPLSWEFHFVYGSALYRLGLLLLHDAAEDGSADAEASDYFDAAKERLETGLDVMDCWILREAIGRVILEKVNLYLKGSDSHALPPEMKLACENAVHSLSVAVSLLDDNNVEEAVGMANLILHHLEFRLDWDDHVRLSNIAQEWFTKVLSVGNSVEALKGMGTSFLNSANALLEISENGEPVDREDLERRLDSALKYFSDARSLLQVETDDTSLLLLLGETLVNKANVLDDRDDSDAADRQYKDAVEVFKKVEAHDASALPSQFSDFLRQWEADLH